MIKKRLACGLGRIHFLVAVFVVFLSAVNQSFAQNERSRSDGEEEVSSPPTSSSGSSSAERPTSQPERERPRRERTVVDSGTVDTAEAGLIAACGLKTPPAGFPFNKDGTLKRSWENERNLKADDSKAFEFNENTMGDIKDSAYTHPLCELFILRGINRTASSNGKGKELQKARCSQIKNELHASDSSLAADKSSGDSGFSAIDGFLSQRRSSGRDEPEDPCEDISEGDTAREFACAYLSSSKELESKVENKRYGKKLLSHCKGLGVNMAPEYTPEEAEALGLLGVDAFGNPCYPRGGNIIIKPRERSTLETVLNATVGALKIAAPIGAMTYIASLQQKNARRSLDYNYQLGFPSIVTAGQGGGGGVGIGFGGYGGGYGGGCVWGGGGCGGHYPGMYGNIYGGAGFTGLGGGCPVGACYGNGGVVVGGGTGVPFAGGAYGGGPCGLPPFANTFVACGAGGGGGMMGPGGIGGIGGAGWGGMPGAGGWGHGSGFPGGWGGVGGIPGGGGAGIGGPWGEFGPGGGGGFGGPGGWGGGPWGPGGQGQFWGADPMNSYAAEAQAQWYQAYARQLAQQAQQQAQAARVYSSTLKDAENIQRKSYQAYMAYQMAASGLGNVGGVGGGFGGGVGGGPAYGIGTPGPNNGYSYFGSPNAGTYYPPYMSNGGRSNLSIGFGVNYSSSAGSRRR